MIDFSRMSTDAFSFLLDDHGFSVSASSQTDITFTSAKTYVRVYWERYDGELDETIGLLSIDPQRRKGFHVEFICQVLRRYREIPPTLYARAESALAPCLTRLAELTTECAMAPVRGDKVSYLTLLYADGVYEREYSRRDLSEPYARERLQMYWDAKDYPGFLQDIGVIEESRLTQEEVRRWKVAREAFLEDDKY